MTNIRKITYNKLSIINNFIINLISKYECLGVNILIIKFNILLIKTESSK